MSSPFAQASTLMDTVASHAALLTTTRIHPGAGDTAETADAQAQGVAQRAILTEDWLTETRALCETQAAVDDGLMAAPKPADLEAWHAQISGSTAMDSASKQAEIHMFLQAAKERREALDAHTAATITDVPALPEGVCEVPVVSMTGEGPEQGGGKPKSEDGFNGEGVDEEGTAPESGADDETPVTMSTGTPETPITMSTGTERETPVTMSDSAANTELSSSTMTSDPATRAALSQPMGQGTPQFSGGSGQPAAMGGVPVSQQLSQPTAQRGGTGTAPRSPEKRREAADKQAERDATVQAASSVTLAGTAGAVAAASMASTPSAPSPSTVTSGAPTAPVTPSATPTNPAPGAGGAPVGGAGMGGVGRGGSLGSGSTVKPIIAAEQPPTLTPEEQRILDEFDKKDGKK